MSIGTWTGNSYKLNTSIKTGTSLLKDFVKIDFTNKTDSKDGSTYYIRFGALLDYLEVNQNPQISTTITNPILKFDTDIGSNLMYVPPFFMPCNPAICIFKNEVDFGLQLTANDFLSFSNPFNFTYGASFRDCEACLVSYNRHSYLKIMNIYINCKFILTTIDQLVSNNTNGNAYVIELLKNICDGICKSTGDLNKLKPIIDETTNTLKIIDENPLPDRDTIISSLNPNSFQEGAVFNIQGFQDYKTDKQSSTFIRDFTMKTELTPEMAMMITAGAAGRGTVVGENASALSRLNNGLEDRYKRQIITAPAIIGNSTNILGISSIFFSQNQQQTPSIGPSLQDQYRETLITYKKYIKNNINGEKPTWNEGNYSELPQIQRTLVDKAISLTQQDLGAAYTTGFIPFNLALQMDGMSGMKPYQKYTINNNFLPSNYPDLLDFYIKTITHDLANNDWTTTLESLAVPNLTAPVTISDIEQNVIPQTIIPQTIIPQTTTNNWANKLRDTLKQLGYLEKGKEIDSSGNDITENMFRAANSLFREIKKQYPTLVIEVTSGNDKYHSNSSSVSRHKLGNALDFKVIPNNPTNLDNVTKILQQFSGGNNPKFRYENEYLNASKRATGGHFHISWGAGTEFASNLAKSIELVKTGKIIPIKIV